MEFEPTIFRFQYMNQYGMNRVSRTDLAPPVQYFFLRTTLVLFLILRGEPVHAVIINS